MSCFTVFFKSKLCVYVKTRKIDGSQQSMEYENNIFPPLN